MRILKSELRLRFKNRKQRPFSRAVSNDSMGTSESRQQYSNEEDSAISSPSTPNSTLSSQINFIGNTSPNTPSPATPTQQTGSSLGTPSTPSTPGTGGAGSSGHKNSLKGTKLARRARSFKDDLFEKISMMRTPTNTLGRSHSPQSPRNKNANTKHAPTAEEVARSSQSLEQHVKDISNALKHFKDVILKKKLEVLPGNGTVILESITNMYAVIQSNTLNENSSVLRSATQQVYQSLGKLIKLCDEVMLSEENADCASLNNENVKEVVDLLETAVRHLVTRTQEKLMENEENVFQYSANTPDIVSANVNINSHLMRPPVEVGQRTSLPDITLTPKERDILEKTNSNPIRSSHSTESILRDTSPPPKPPLPISLSVRSRSPDENSSQCSMDSALNHSQEEELKLMGLEHIIDRHDDDIVTAFPFKSQLTGVGKFSDRTDGVGANNLNSNSAGIHNANIAAASTITPCKPELRKAALNNRHSNESGFVSMKSYRVSKHSSEYSIQSSTKSSNPDMVFAVVDSSEFHQHQQQQQHFSLHQRSGSSGFNTSTAEEHHQISSSSSTKIYSSTSSSISGLLNEEGLSQSQENSFEKSEMRGCIGKTQSLDAKCQEVAEEMHAGVPPALPPKVNRAYNIDNNKDRSTSEADEVDDIHELAELRSHHHHRTQQHVGHPWHSKHHSLMETTHTSNSSTSTTTSLTLVGSCINLNMEEPPPLPMKKKHILAYMEICSASTRSVDPPQRYTIHGYNMNRNIPHSQTLGVMPIANEVGSSSPDKEAPPALPPKNYKQRKSIGTTPTIITTPPPSPKPTHMTTDVETAKHHNRILSNTQGEIMSTVCEELAEDDPVYIHHSHNFPNEESSAVDNVNTSWSNNHNVSKAPICTPDVVNDEDEGIDVVLEPKSYHSKKATRMLEELDISSYLILKKETDDGPEVKGGYIDALIVHASRIQKISDNEFSEAFITTFRTFIQPVDVIEKLTHRYTVFFCQTNDQKQKAAKETFSLLVRVVNDLTCTDLTNSLLTLLVEFVYQLVCSGELTHAKLLRNKIVEKVTLYKELKQIVYHPEASVTAIHEVTLLDLKSVEIAEQMTLLDADLFQKIEIPEVLLFAKEQCEEKSPNLNKFTEHFNKMSYWARSKILKADAKEREKHVVKFIKIMKHLRKMNNYNSYLALLSALDSAPIRRLEWQKSITDSLKDFCTLIDSSSSFRAYRQALADTSPPCIPYIGLVLQDLTFVHVGNPDYLKEGVINFSKRWQQYNIIVNMKRFRKCAYPFKRSDRIIRFFGNFDKYMGEEEMWQTSELIKPRGKRPTHN